MLEETQEVKRTCSTIFLLPGIGLKRQSILKHGFVSAYMDDVNHDVHYENSVYVLYKPEQIEEFQKFLSSEYKRTPLLVEDYDYPGGYVVTVYKFPKEFMEEYDLFLKGKYSKFSKKYMDLFPVRIDTHDPETGMTKMKYSLQYHILNRSDAMKRYWEEKLGMEGELPEDLEYWKIPDKKEETLNINEL